GEIENIARTMRHPTEVAPAHCARDVLDLSDRHPCGERAADERSGGSPGHAVNPDAVLLEDLEHADVRDAARRAARKRKPQPWPAAPSCNSSPHKCRGQRSEVRGQ